MVVMVVLMVLTESMVGELMVIIMVMDKVLLLVNLVKVQEHYIPEVEAVLAIVAMTSLMLAEVEPEVAAMGDLHLLMVEMAQPILVAVAAEDVNLMEAATKAVMAGLGLSSLEILNLLEMPMPLCLHVH